MNGRISSVVADLVEAVCFHQFLLTFVRATLEGQRSELNAARISVVNSSGSSQAAKWPPFSTSLK